MEDLSCAIAIWNSYSTVVNHPNYAEYLNGLECALQMRFDRKGSMEDLNRAIETKEQAVKSPPVDHPDHAMYLNNLGSALQSRLETTGGEPQSCS